MQVSPVVLDQEKKCAHLEEMLRSLNLSREKGSSNRVIAGDSTVQQLRDQNAVLVNVCLELGNELFALKYKREEYQQQRLQQVDALNRTNDVAAGGGGGVGAASAAVAGGNGPGNNGGSGQM